MTRPAVGIILEKRQLMRVVTRTARPIAKITVKPLRMAARVLEEAVEDEAAGNII
jgi:hypothetical protein